MSQKSISPKPKTESPPSPLQQKPHFKNGTIVEISSDDDGFRGSWYTGKVIRRASSKNPNKYLIEYEKLFKDELGTKRLKEILDLAQLRPLAPREKKRKFRFGEKVDAYHNDGWWEGSITEEREDGKFAVFFRGTREQIVFGEEDLRLHREWVDGQWTPPLEGFQGEKLKEEETVVEKKVDTIKLKEEETVVEKKVDTIKLKEEETVADKKVDTIEEVVEKLPDTIEVNHTEAEKSFSKGMEVEVCSDEEGLQGAWFAAIIVEMVGKDKYLVEYKSLRTEDDTGFLREEIDTAHLRPCPPETIMVDSFKLLQEVDASYNDGWWVGIISKVLTDCKYIVYFRDTQEEMMFRHSELRPHQDWIAGEWISPSSAL